MKSKQHYDPNEELDPNSPQNQKYKRKESNECWGCYSEECRDFGCVKGD